MGNNSFYETTIAVLCILPSRMLAWGVKWRKPTPQDCSVSWCHRFGVKNNRRGNGGAAPHGNRTWPEGHSRVRHEVLPLLPAELLRQRLRRQHLRAVAKITEWHSQKDGWLDIFWKTFSCCCPARSRVKVLRVYYHNFLVTSVSSWHFQERAWDLKIQQPGLFPGSRLLEPAAQP